MKVLCGRPPEGLDAVTVAVMEMVDVLVVGAGLAGLHTARLLAARGLDVLVVDRRSTLDTGIRTTGIFVRRTLEDFALPAGQLGPAIRRVLLYPPSLREPVELVSALRSRFRVRLLMRQALSAVRSPALTEAAFAALRTRPGRVAAARVLFGDGSFPGPRPGPAHGDAGGPRGPTGIVLRG